MKIEYGLNKLARISFETRGQVNPMVNMPMLDENGKQRIEDVWESIEGSAARAIDELQKRIFQLEQALDVKNTEKNIERALGIVATASMKPPSRKYTKKAKAEK